MAGRGKGRRSGVYDTRMLASAMIGLALGLASPDGSDGGSGDGGLADICKIDPKQCETVDLKYAAARPLNPRMYAGYPPRPLAWVGVGGRNAFGFESKLNADFGIEAIAGGWLLFDTLQPSFKIGWSHENRGGATVDAARFGPGLAVGWSFWRPSWGWYGVAWLGAAIDAAYVHTWARPSGGGADATAWSGSFGLSALFQLRILRRFLLGVQAGPEVDFPTLHFPGMTGGMDWGPFRFNAGLRLGAIIP